MPRQTPWEDEFTLLCERCGYVLEGLDPEVACPECGKDIWKSLPERRVGTPWQHEQMFGPFVRTAWVTLSRPIATLDAIKPGPTGDRGLFRMYAVLASFPIALGLGMSAVPVMRELGLDALDPKAQFTIAFVVGLSVVYACVALLTMIERRGLGFLGARRGDRITRAISGSITAHGSVGWFVGSWLMSAVVLIGAGAGGMEHADSSIPWIIASIGAMVSGFLFFEVFAFLGLRRLRYANRSRPAPDEPRP